MSWNEEKILFTRTYIKIMDVNRVIKIDTLFFTPQYKNIINETDKIKYLDLFLIINYHSYFEGKMQENLEGSFESLFMEWFFFKTTIEL